MRKLITLVAVSVALLATGCSDAFYIGRPVPTPSETYSKQFLKVVSPLIVRENLSKGAMCSVKTVYTVSGVMKAYEIMAGGSALLCSRVTDAIDAAQKLNALPVLPKTLRLNDGDGRLILDFYI